MAEWIVGGESPVDLWPVDIRRFGPHQQDVNVVRERTLELYGKHYSMPWPFEEHQSARPLRVSQLYDRLKDQGASFGEKMGWERPNWFAPDGVEPNDDYSFGRQNWFPHVGNEHKAVRRRVGLFDQSSFAKFEMRGAGAETALSWICANNVSKPVGSIIYTQMLNSRGGIECDLTVARMADDIYYIVTGTGYRTYDYSWISRNIPDDCDAELVDITDDGFTLSLMGPKARDVLSKASNDDISNEAFPFGNCRKIEIAGTSVKALRITYVGELGWNCMATRKMRFGSMMH